MEIAEFLRLFLNSETPFMLLFVSLFFYTVKANKDRETRYHDLIDQRLIKIDEELNVLIKVWKILLEKELEDKK